MVGLPAPDGPVTRTLADAFSGVAWLGDDARAALAPALTDCGCAVPADGDLASVPLTGIGDAGHRQSLRLALQAALRRRWDTAAAGPSRLDELTPGCARLGDGPLEPGACAPRLAAVLERAGCGRWSEVLDRTVAEVAAWTDVGPVMLADLVGMCFERSLRGLALDSLVPATDDLALILDSERLAPDQPVLRALLATLAEEGPPGGGPEAVERVLQRSAPWALDLEGQLRGVLSAVDEGRDRAMFLRGSLRADQRPTLAELATEWGISTSRVGQIRDRAQRVARAALAASPPPLSWVIADIRRRLGAVTTEHAAAELLGRLGITSADLALWLAGPYEPVPDCWGWLAVDATTAVACTSACVEADGGVRGLADVAAELTVLGLRADQLVGWLAACGAALVSDDLVVSVSGPLVAVVERLLDAHGQELAVEDLAACMAAGGRHVATTAVEAAVRSRRFRRGDGLVGLAEWSKPVLTPAAPEFSSPPPGEPVDVSGAGGRLWLWVRVNEEVLRGGEGGVPLTLVEGVGLQPNRRRTFSSRYGPVTLARDGPNPMRGSVRAVVLAAGAALGDTILLGFSASGDVAVEVRHPSADHPVAGEPAELTTVAQGAP